MLVVGDNIQHPLPAWSFLGTSHRRKCHLFKGTPQIREHYLDSKKDVDHHLKSACEQFIQQQTRQFVEQLAEFMTKVGTWCLGQAGAVLSALGFLSDSGGAPPRFLLWELFGYRYV